MGHHHHDDDDHHHDHHDHHDHHHHEQPDQHHHGSKEASVSSAPPSEQEKLLKMVQHWIHHNEEHARSYRQWGDRARTLGQAEVGRILDSIAEENLRLNAEMERILGILRP